MFKSSIELLTPIPALFINTSTLFSRIERAEVHNKLTPKEISHSIVSAIEMDDRGFINELNIWATNPFN